MFGGLRHLHAGVVDDHLLILDGLEVLGYFSAAFEEEAVGEFHDVSLVDDGDFLSSGEEGGLEGVAGQSNASISGDDLQTFEDSGVHFVLDSGVLSLQVVSENSDVDLVVSGLDIGELEGSHHYSKKQVEG